MTISPWDREKLRQRAVEDRKTEERATKDRASRELHVVPIPGSRYYEIRQGAPPKETLVLDEMRVTPSKKYRDEETVRQAKQVLAQSKSGKPADPADIERLQQRLGSMERQAELTGRESESKQLVEELGEVRRADLVNKALDTLARAKKGRVADRSIEKLQMKLMTMQQRDEIAGRESEGRQLTEALGEVRRSQLVTDAKDMLARGSRKTRIDPRAIYKQQVRLLEMERQDEIFGRDSEGRQLAEALGEVRRSQLVAEAKDVLARAKRGRQFPDAEIKKLQLLLGEMERQDQERGRASEGMELATELSRLRH